MNSNYKIILLVTLAVVWVGLNGCAQIKQDVIELQQHLNETFFGGGEGEAEAVKEEE
jgi:hypothetical protein